MMLAYCFRSGHVFLGRAVPPGAIELAAHDSEEDLLTVVRRHTAQMSDAEGCPQMVIPELVGEMSLVAAYVTVGDAKGRIARGLDSLMKGHGNTRYAVGPIVPWAVGASCEARA